jgi:hypothetical protein
MTGGGSFFLQTAFQPAGKRARTRQQQSLRAEDKIEEREHVDPL